MAHDKRNLVCPIRSCQKRFYSQFDLQEHQDESKHHYCLTCDSRFVLAYFLQEHQEEKGHKNATATVAVATSSPGHAQILRTQHGVHAHMADRQETPRRLYSDHFGSRDSDVSHVVHVGRGSRDSRDSDGMLMRELMMAEKSRERRFDHFVGRDAHSAHSAHMKTQKTKEQEYLEIQLRQFGIELGPDEIARL